LFLLLALATSDTLHAQPRPYIGYVYPAGGQQGTTVQIRIGGQGLDGLEAIRVSGTRVTARLVEYLRPLNNQEMQLLNEQLRILKQPAKTNAATTEVMMSESPMMTSANSDQNLLAAAARKDCQDLIDKIEKRTREFVQTPASPAIASLALVEITIATDAEPGEREIRLVTLRGISNPLPFEVGQVPEFSRTPMQTSVKQILGKESQALRKRPPREVENQITLPCTVNGQIASGEVNRYRFEAHKGQRLVIQTLARQLVPFIADAVPGWFQPVLTLYDTTGKEVAYDDDYRFKPDPTILFEVPADGHYLLEIRDSIYRGREDFVYRTTMGEQPFISSIFPMGQKIGGPGVSPKLNGWNLEGADLTALAKDAAPGIYSLAAWKRDLVSNYIPFAADTLDETFEREPNNARHQAQKLALPIIVNGRIGHPDDWDVFEFFGRSNETVVAEVQARQLDSPLDSVLKLTDADGKLVAFNDDHEDLTAGINTHQADSYLIARLPADGTYYVHLGDTARQGGEEFGYRLRLSAPLPDFDLRVVPSSLSLRAKSSGTLTVYARRKDGFSGPIKIELKDPPTGFSASPLTLSPTQVVARLTVKTTLANAEPVTLLVMGSARITGHEIRKEAVPAEDRMQAFLWRHLVPAKDLEVMVFDPSYPVPPKRVAPSLPPVVLATNEPAATNAGTTITNANPGTNLAVASSSSSSGKPKFTKQQVAARLRQLKALYEEGMLTDNFYLQKVSECEAVH
jgi:hypothetical protein